MQTECVEIMAILTSKILDLERLSALGKAKIAEESESYLLSLANQSDYPFVETDYA